MARDLDKRNGLDALIDVLAKNSPDLGNLNVEQLKIIGKAVVFDSLKQTLQKKVDARRIDYQKEKETYLGRFQSIHTRIAYSYALKRLETYCSTHGLNIIELNPAQADDFIIEDQKGHRSPASVRLAVTGCSAFFTWMERRHQDSLKNPFRGNRERPKLKAIRPLNIPTREEIEIVIAMTEDKLLKSAFIILLNHGLRAGGLTGLVIRNGRFTTISKGKENSGKISEICLVALKTAHANLNSPFGMYTPQQLKDALQYQINKVYKAGKIKTRFHLHGIRHKFAIDFYERNKDIYRLKLALHHSSISVTEGYLKGLGIDETVGISQFGF